MISIQRLSKSYETPAGPFPALRRIDLEIGQGQLVAVVGKSGSGKSTLLNMIGGIDSPSEGAISVGGKSILDMSPSRLAVWRGRNVGFVFQFFQLLPTLTVAENVMLPMDFLGAVPARDRRRRALEILDRLSIADQSDKLPARLSGGQQQRVAIARALANDPSVVLADEPTGNLDSETARSILGLFLAMAAAGTTVVVATHEPGIAAAADRKVEIADGAIAAGALPASRPEREIAG